MIHIFMFFMFSCDYMKLHYNVFMYCYAFSCFFVNQSIANSRYPLLTSLQYSVHCKLALYHLQTTHTNQGVGRFVLFCCSIKTRLVGHVLFRGCLPDLCLKSKDQSAVAQAIGRKYKGAKFCYRFQALVAKTTMSPNIDANTSTTGCQRLKDRAQLNMKLAIALTPNDPSFVFELRHLQP